MSVLDKLPFIGAYRANVRNNLRIYLIHRTMEAVLREKFEFEFGFRFKFVKDESSERSVQQHAFQSLCDSMPNLESLFDHGEYDKVENYLLSISDDWIKLTAYMRGHTSKLMARPVIGSGKSPEQLYEESASKTLLTKLENKDYVPICFNYFLDFAGLPTYEISRSK